MKANNPIQSCFDPNPVNADMHDDTSCTYMDYSSPPSNDSTCDRILIS